MNCQILGSLTMVVAAGISILFVVGSTFLGRFGLFRAAFRYIGWPIAAIVVGAFWYTCQGMTTSFQSASPFLALPLAFLSAICLLAELAMFCGLILLIGGAKADGKTLDIPESSLLDKALKCRWDSIDGPYKKASGRPQDICSLSWLMAINLAGSPIMLLAVVVLLLCECPSVFLSGHLSSREKLLAFSPAAVIAMSFPGALASWLLIRHFIYMPHEWSITLFIGAWGLLFVLIAWRYEEAIDTLQAPLDLPAPVKVPMSTVLRPAQVSVQRVVVLCKTLKAAACPTFRSA